jgi:hypothetical protein
MKIAGEPKQTKPRLQQVKFEFDERSLVPLEQLRARGCQFEEITVRDRILLIPINWGGILR